MIFSTVKNISNKDEFLELILVYIRIVEVIAEKNKTVITNATLSDSIILEIKDMGIIDNMEDLTLLKTITKDLYGRFINCVCLNSATL